MRDLRKGRRKEAVTVYFFNVIRHKLILHKPTRVLYAAKGGCFEVREEKKKRRYCFTEHMHSILCWACLWQHVPDDD